MKLNIGEVVTVRSSVTHSILKGRLIYINWKYGWYTAEVKVRGGKYREAFFIRELDDEPKRDKRERKGITHWDLEEDPNKWLDEWSEDNYDAEEEGFL